MTTDLSRPAPAQVQSSSAAGQVVLRLKLVGHMEARALSGESVLPAGRKTRALLAVIALSSPRPVLRGRLAELLWSRRPEEQARASLRQEIHRLLESLSPAGEVLSVNRDHIQLRPGVAWIDVDEVLRATAEHSAPLSLFQGDLLEDLDGIDSTFDMWLTTERERVRDRARTLAEALLREQVEPETAIPAAQRLLQIDRAHEGAWRALMRAHAVRGERGMAIEAYDRCCAVLADHLDASPSPETQKLLAEIRGPSGRVAMRPAARPTQADVTSAEPSPTQTPTREPLSHRRGPHIGVMPFQVVGGAEQPVPPASGLADEITIALARFRWLAIVASNSLARFGHDSGVAAIRSTFGVDYLLEGSIQPAGDQLRIGVRLLDLAAGNQVTWAQRFNGASHDLLSLQDDVAAKVAAQVDAEMLRVEAKRSAARPLMDATAYDSVMRAVPLLGRLERDPFFQAGTLLADALELEPDYAAGHAWLAYWQTLLVSQDWADDLAMAQEQAGHHAERAIVLDPLDARCLTIAGHVRAFMHRRPQEAVTLHDRALSLNENLAMAWALSAVAFAYSGDLAEAKRHLDRYKTLSPHDPHACFFDMTFVLLHLLRHDHDRAVSVGRAVSEMNPLFTATYKPYLAALGHLGQTQEAARVRRRLLAIEPDFTIKRFLAGSPFERDSDRDHFADGLRRAGMPADSFLP